MNSSSNSSHEYNSREASVGSIVSDYEEPCFKSYCCMCFSHIYYFCCYFPCNYIFKD